MVWESYYWKVRLKEIAFEIEQLTSVHEPSELDIARLEIEVFTAFFLIRKLLEAETKLSRAASSLKVNCSVSTKVNAAPNVDLLNRFDTYKLYKLGEFENRSVSLRTVCNLFIHSIFMWMDWDEADDFISGVRLTSSYEKEKAMYSFKMGEILATINRIANDEVSLLSMERDAETGEMRVAKS